MSATTTTTSDEDWSDCIGFGSNNLNADSNADIVILCEQKYNKFTAEIAPQKMFDSSREVTLYFYKVEEGKEIIIDSYEINSMTEPQDIIVELSDVKILRIEKKGDYSPSIYAGQYINDYRGMCVLMRDATLHKE